MSDPLSSFLSSGIPSLRFACCFFFFFQVYVLHVLIVVITTTHIYWPLSFRHLTDITSFHSHYNPMGNFPGGSVVKDLPASAGHPGDLGSIPGSENGNPLQYSSLGGPTDRRSWWVTVHGVAKSLAWLSKRACVCMHVRTRTHMHTHTQSYGEVFIVPQFIENEVEAQRSEGACPSPHSWFFSLAR